MDNDSSPEDSVARALVQRVTRGPGRPVTLDEARRLAESAMWLEPRFVVESAEVPGGWEFALESARYLETRSDLDISIGEGPTFVDRNTGDVYRSGSASPHLSKATAFVRALADGTGAAQIPQSEQLQPTIDLYYGKLMDSASAETDRVTRDRLWLHALDAVRLRRLVRAGSVADELRRTTVAASQALKEFPLLGAEASATHAAFELFEHAVQLAAR